MTPSKPPSTTRNGARPPLLRLAAILALSGGLAACDVSNAHGEGSRPGAEAESSGDAGAPGLNSALETRLDSLDDAELSAVYGATPAPLWVDADGLTDEGEAALSRLRASDAQGLESSNYDADDIEQLHAGVSSAGEPSASDLVELEIRVTRSLSTFSMHLARGGLVNEPFKPHWHLDSLDREDLPDSASAERVLAHLDSVTPQARQYTRLQALLARLRTLEGEGGWPSVPEPGDVVEVGDSAEVVGPLRARLSQSLDPEERRLAEQGGSSPLVFDSALVRSLEGFQARHGLARDGVLGPKTLEELNAPVAKRIDEVLVALERWRWLPASLGTPAVLVNTPARRVHVMEDGAPVLSMKVIIGQRDWETALFQDEMERIVVNPYWNVPRSILEEETLPKARENPSYLWENDFEVVDPDTHETVPLSAIDWSSVDPATFPYRMRQKPGEQNALGYVKFLFPNRFNIYLHDTPADHLFDERVRAFSHGCVRVEHPDRLAHYLFREATEHPPSRFDELRATGERHEVELDRKIPTYLIYQTVWVDDSGVPTFAPDVYDRNAAVGRALAEARGEPYLPGEE